MATPSLLPGELPAGVEVETSVSHTTERVEQICTYAVPLSETQEKLLCLAVGGIIGLHRLGGGIAQPLGL